MIEKQFTTRAAARPATVQRRRVERVQAILGAAEALLSEQGYDAATLKAIGERAGIPTASVYHYFADRHEVEYELLQRHVRALDERVTTALDNATQRTLRNCVDAVIDPIVAYFREHPSSVRLWFAATPHEKAVELVQAFDDSKAEQLWQLLLEWNLLQADTPRLVMQTAFVAGDALLNVAFQNSPTGDDRTIDEARRLVSAYLDTYASPRGGN